MSIPLSVHADLNLLFSKYVNYIRVEMPGGTFSRRNKKVSFTAWNIRGVSDKVIGDKLQNDCFISNIKNNDIIVLTETWTRTDVQVSGFKSFVSKLNNCSSSGRTFRRCMPFG